MTIVSQQAREDRRCWGIDEKRSLNRFSHSIIRRIENIESVIFLFYAMMCDNIRQQFYDSFRLKK